MVCQAFYSSTWEAETGGWISEFEASLAYRACSRTTRPAQRNPITETKNLEKLSNITSASTFKFCKISNYIINLDGVTFLF